MKRHPGIAVVAAVTFALSGCASSLAHEPEAPTTIGDVAVVHTNPLSEDEYVAEFGSRSDSVTQDGIRDEYWRAAATFPFPLPDGYAFPADPILWGENDRYEGGYGAADAFSFWSGATATAAWAAYERGDEDTANQLLDALESGHVSPVRSIHLEPDSPGTDASIIDHAIRPARGGNFAPMLQWEIEPFLERDENHAIATNAGDVQ
ncbi:hypothetical protein [uncultured Agrococcus sp.]|uniref:hypothetical protein n=1 Tax=uncultured Agrococcus sp. TaxID=382258 RepID=UPI0025D5EC08|nr:hypothetical protein [uncultured Agrococcus sp.]